MAHLRQSANAVDCRTDYRELIAFLVQWCASHGVDCQPAAAVGGQSNKTVLGVAVSRPIRLLGAISAAAVAVASFFLARHYW